VRVGALAGGSAEGGGGGSPALGSAPLLRCGAGAVAAPCRRSLSAGPWPLAPGPWPLAPGPWPLAPGPWPLAPGPWPLPGLVNEAWSTNGPLRRAATCCASLAELLRALLAPRPHLVRPVNVPKAPSSALRRLRRLLTRAGAPPAGEDPDPCPIAFRHVAPPNPAGAAPGDAADVTTPRPRPPLTGELRATSGRMRLRATGGTSWAVLHSTSLPPIPPNPTPCSTQAAAPQARHGAGGCRRRHRGRRKCTSSSRLGRRGRRRASSSSRLGRAGRRKGTSSSRPGRRGHCRGRPARRRATRPMAPTALGRADQNALTSTVGHAHGHLNANANKRSDGCARTDGHARMGLSTLSSNYPLPHTTYRFVHAMLIYSIHYFSSCSTSTF
jgi:hypothetical protein